MSPRSDSSESTFPEPFSARAAGGEEASASAGELPPPFRVGGEDAATPAADASKDERGHDDQGDALPWLVTEDEAGSAGTAEIGVPAGGAESVVSEGGTDETGLEPGGGVVAPLPDWLDLDEPEGMAEQEPARGDDDEARADVASPTGSFSEAEDSEDQTASDAAEVSPPLARAGDAPDPTPPAGTSVLAGGVLDGPGDEAAEEVREPEGGSDAAPSSELAKGRVAAARRLEEIAGWLREADLEQELDEADERGMRLFLAGIVLGREGAPGR